MRVRFMGVAIFALIAGCSLSNGVACAEATATINSCSTNTSTKTTTLNFTVTGLTGNDRLKDIHIYPPVQDPPTNPAKPPRLPKKSGTTATITNVSTQAETSATMKQDVRTTVHICSSTGVQNGTYTVDIPWAWSNNDTPTLDNAGRIVFTDNGMYEYDDGDVIGVTGNGQVPVYNTASINGDSPITVAIGDTTEIPCFGDPVCVGTSYTIYTSLSTSDYREDLLEVGVYSETDPVPVAWDLSFNNFTGTLGDNGNPMSAPSVTVPYDTELSGSTFYISFAISQEREVVSCPVCVTIE